MYQIQQDKLNYFEKEIDNPNRKITYKFSLNDESIQANQIMDNIVLTTDTGLDQYGVGCALVTQLQMSLKSDVLIIPNDKIAIQVGLDIYNEVTQQWETIYTPLGVFYVDTIEEKGSKKSIKAYDGMFKLNKGYFPTSKHTTTQAIANDIATSNGYKIKGISNVSINNEQLEGKTCLEMLSLVASAIGGHVRMSRCGSTIEFIEPTNYGETYDESDYTTPTIDDTTSYNITKLRVNYSDQVTNDEGTVTDEGYYEVGSGTDANTLAISNPLLKGQKSQAQIILDKVKRLNGYKRFDTSMPLADFRLEPMDIITYIKGEKEYIVPILYMKMTLSYKGISIETQSPTLAETKSEFSFKGTLTQKVENIYTDIIQVKQLTANKVTTDELEATVAKIEQLYVTKVDADEIYANKAEIGDLVAGSIVVEDLKSQVAQVESLVANKANITDLNAINATINNLKADVAEIDDLISNSIISGIIQSGSISSDLLNIKNGFIKDAMIDSVTASKINSGVINTNNVTIQSSNGNMKLQGNLLQFKDKNGKVRIQIGQDTTGNYTFTLYDATGQGVLINQDGVQSSNAIKDGLIVDSKVSSNANISGSKLNINSVYDEMNKDGSKTLKASKVLLDEQKQTLDVSFKQMTTKQDELEESMSTAITDISVAQGQISQLIQDTTITTSSGSTKLKDAYNSTKSTVDSHTTQIGKMQTTIDANTGEITSTKNEVTTIKADLNEIELGLSSVEKNIGDNYYTKSQTDSQIKATKDSINLGISQTYETKTSVSSQVSTALTSAKSYTDTKKSEAISTASSDATSKANNALNSAKSYADTKKSEAITSANNTLNSTIANYYTKSQTDSQIKVAKDAIDLSVKNTYETKTNVQNKIDAIQVGGRNLLPRARTFENWQGVGQNGVKVVKDGFKTGMNSLKFAQGGEAIVDNELQKKALKNLANTHMIVTNPEDSAYSLYPNPPKGSTFNSVNRDGSLRKGEISSNGSCWAIISAYKYYTEVPTSSAIEQKLLQIMKDCADFMCDNLSVGRFNSMNFEFIDTSYKYSSETRAGWTVGTYKELYLSTMFLQVKSLTYAYEIHKNQRYLDTAYKVLDSLYNVQIYIKDKVAKGDLPTEADGAFYEYLACDNLSSSNRFSGSTRILPLGMGYYITQAVDTLIEIVGDNERITAKGDSYRPSTIKTEYAKFLSSMIKTGNLTAKPTNLPYGHYYKSEDGTFKLGNWNFIDNAFGDEWFVGDVVCYTIIGLASLGFETEARQYMNAYYSLKVPNSSGRFAGDIVFYDRIDFSTGTHLPDDDSVSITYTALYMETGVILKEMTHVENCANTLLKWQVSEPNNIKVDGAYMWDISKDTSSLELKSYGEIVNSEFFKYLSPQKIRNRATTASVSTALTSNIVGKEFALSGWLKASDWNALASGLNACLKIGGKTYASLKLSDVIKNNNWTRFELLGSVEKEDEILTFELINNTSTTVEVAVLKLEKGNKITDFTDAPEDVEDNIVTSKNDAISSANNTLATTIANYYTKSQTDSQIEVVKDSITQSVASTYETKSDVTSKINGVNSSISNLQSRMSSAESKITDTAITNTVKKNFYTKTETEDSITSKGYTTQSQVQQTVNNLQIKFAESGGYNLFLNSGFKKNMSYWGTHTHNSPTGGSIGITTSTGEWGFPDASVNCVHIKLSNQSGIEYGISQTVKTTIGKKYTISFYYAGHRLNSANLIVRNSNSSWLASKAITSFPSGGNGNANNWSKHTLTFTANATSHNINIVIVSAGENGYMWVAKPQVVEGELDLPYSPNPNEMYDGIIEMNKDGVTVKGSNGAYTNFNSTGMNSFNNSGQQTLGIRNGGITFHPYSSNQLGAYITQSALHGNSAAANGLAISTANNGTYISLGTSSLSDANTTLNMDQALTVSANDNFQPKGINLWKDTHAHGYGIRQLSHLRLAGSGAIQFDYLNTSPSTIYEAVDGGHSLYVMGGYQTHIGCMDGQGTPKGVIWMQNSTNTHSYTHWNFHNYTMYNMKTATSYANTLSRKVNEVYGVNSNVEGIRYLYKNVELINGKAVRSIPNEFVGCGYDIVSIVCKGKGQAWVEVEEESRFEIQGDCKSVNIEIIIYPSEDVMMISTVQPTEAPALELPDEVVGEEAPLITNETHI